jgi:hypothetical protein
MSQGLHVGDQGVGRTHAPVVSESILIANSHLLEDDYFRCSTK